MSIEQQNSPSSSELLLTPETKARELGQLAEKLLWMRETEANGEVA